ncbi:unnamed protein product [Leptidea sinapis]|uniref:Attacin C-terminal domain-containing protein n=1 Tax=Leptidea sinapis TaxID=189913 RepID=A0A5E4QCF3_9NEOP|nr:unnamed protein product [Leptidea sinapis]
MLSIIYLSIFYIIGTQAVKFELAGEKTPYDYVQEKLDSMLVDVKSGMPLSGSYEVEESEDYPEENLKGSPSTIHNSVAGYGLGQGIGLGGIGGLGFGQGLGIGLGGAGVGGLGIGNVGGLGIGGLNGAVQTGLVNGAGLGTSIVGNGLIHPGYGGIGVGGVGIGNGLIYHHPILGGQVQGGANEEQVKKAKSHKKGHVSKGFKSSSSKNEEEKSESFYDEAHDEADHKIAGQNAGSFGENSQQGFKGAHEEKILDANAQGKEGHHVSEQKIDDSKANKGEFLQKGYKGGAELLEKFNNLGAHAVHGHQEASGGYQQSKGILPIH